MTRTRNRSRSTSRLALSTLLCCSLMAVLCGTAQADMYPRPHLAIDGVALDLGEARNTVAVGRHDDIDATGIRLRAGLEFGRAGHGYGGHDWHRSGESRPPRDDRDSRREPRRRPVHGHRRVPRLGMELHVAFTTTDRYASQERTDVSLFGGYLTGRVPLGPVLSIKGLAGLTSLNGEHSESSARADVRQTGAGFGVGLEASLGRYTDLTVDWMRYLADDAPREEEFERVSALGVGIKVRF